MAIVDVIMTVHTLAPQVTENPLFLLEMTGKTRGSQMGSVQWKSSFGVVLKRVKAALKTLNCVAVCTITYRPFTDELALVIICMTGCTGVVS